MSPTEVARTQNSLPLRQQPTRATIAELSEQSARDIWNQFRYLFPKAGQGANLIGFFVSGWFTSIHTLSNLGQVL